MVETQLKPNTSAPTLRTRLAQRKKPVLGSAVVLFLAGLFTAFGAGSASADPEKCSWYDIGCTLGQAAGSVAGNAVGGTFEKIVNSLVATYGKMIELALSWWMAMPSPKLDPRGSVGVLATVREYTFQLQVIGLMVSLVLVGIRMAMSRKGLVEESEQAWMALVRAVFGSTLFATFVVAGSVIGDAFSNWVLKDAVLKGESAQKVAENLGLAVISSGPLAGNMIAGIGLITLFGFLGALLQLVLLVIRQVMLIVVVAFVPIAATWSGTGPGSQSYDKLKQWTIAFLLFKPIGALVYVIAFSAAGDKSDDFQMKLLGMILLAMVALVLPSLMRLVAPAVASMGGGGSGMAAAGMAVGAAMAGAKVAGMVATGGGSAAATAGASPVASRAATPGATAAMNSGGGDDGGGEQPGPTSSPGGPPPGGGGGDSGGGGDPSSGAGPDEALNGASPPSGGGSGGGAGEQINQQVGNETSAGEGATKPPPSLERPELASGHGEHAMKG
ncbi:hypothetical protein GCM10009648_22200 [Tsukamurella spumae]